MVGDELDDKLRRAAQADDPTVERVVAAALLRQQRSRMGGRSLTLGALALTVLAILGVGTWVSRRLLPPPGVYRVSALPAPAEPAPAAVVAPISSDGVYRVEADRAVRTSQVIRVTTDDGTMLILSTSAPGELPAGSAIVTGGGESK